MRSRERDRESRRADRFDESGSLLVEWLVGIGLLGLITASVATMLPAVIEAGVRAESHHAALVLGDALLEAAVGGISTDRVSSLDVPDRLRVEPRVEHEVDGTARPGTACSSASVTAAQRTTVNVVHGGRTDGRDVTLGAGRRIAASGLHGTNTLVLRTDAARGVPADALVLIGPDGEERSAGLSQDGCLRYDGLPNGTSWITSAEDEYLLVDRTHVPLVQRGLPVSFDGRSHDLNVDVSPAGWLRVVADDGDARRPEPAHVASGGLQWLVRGDDANVLTDLDAARPVHPGLVAAVIPACGDANAVGSSGSVVVQSGEEVTLQIPLVVVTVTGIGDRAHAWLRFRRTTSCADGSGSRATLLFEGELHDGMRVAIPHGEWDVSLGRTARNALTGSSRVVAEGRDVEVRIP